jgi:hypothetical protein
MEMIVQFSTWEVNSFEWIFILEFFRTYFLHKNCLISSWGSQVTEQLCEQLRTVSISFLESLADDIESGFTSLFNGSGDVRFFFNDSLDYTNMS